MALTFYSKRHFKRLVKKELEKYSSDNRINATIDGIDTEDVLQNNFDEEEVEQKLYMCERNPPQN